MKPILHFANTETAQIQMVISVAVVSLVGRERGAISTSMTAKTIHAYMDHAKTDISTMNAIATRDGPRTKMKRAVQ